MIMRHSNHSVTFSFRKSIDDAPRRHSLKITTTTPNNTSFKQKMTSLFTSSPVMASLKESFHKKRRSFAEEDIITDSPMTVGQPYEHTILDHNTTALLTPPSTPSMKSFDKEEVKNSLAYQVHQVLGSAIEEVDEEIDKDWEASRTVLEENLLIRNDKRYSSWTISF
ncbi:hypothetical protein RMATCC62417_10264 [Rhizopus microsporus]|nr:hypothetical protein RMATCC62417_10264 [Rhizopus microsporus]CEI98252.1 hypothetical protein RMCBS344292_12367 [Rhizopus microsporus]